MKSFRTGTEARCPGTLSIPIDDDHKFTVNDYREKLYQQARAFVLCFFCDACLTGLWRGLCVSTFCLAGGR